MEIHILKNFVIQCLHSNFFFFFFDSKSLFEPNSPHIFSLCEKNLIYFIDSSNISVRGYLLFIWKDSVTYMRSLTVYIKEDFLWKLKWFFCMFLTGFIKHKQGSLSQLFSWLPYYLLRILRGTSFNANKIYANRIVAPWYGGYQYCNNFIQQSLNWGSAQVLILLATC